MGELFPWKVNKSSLGKTWWVSFGFSSFTSQLSPKGGPSEELQQGTGNREVQERHCLTVLRTGERGTWEPEGVGEIYFFSSFFLFQLRPKVSVSHGAARQWRWQKKHWKPHTITYHCKHRNRGERPCHLKSAGEPVIFFSLFLTVWPHGWPQSCRTAWQYNGKNFNRNLSLRP